MNWELIADVLASICFIVGALLSLAAGLGLLRFPDLLTRMHAATKPQVLGLLLVLLGVAFRMRSGPVIGVLVLIACAQLLTAPVAAHMVGRAAYRAGSVPTDDLVTDELGRDLRAEGASESEDR